MRFVVACEALFLALPLCAQVQDESQAPVRTYNLLRENDDWSFLADPSLRRDFWDPVKYIPLGCEACYVSLGGEVRQVLDCSSLCPLGLRSKPSFFLARRSRKPGRW